MRLYLMRHGRAESRADWTAPDAGRPLTDEGRARTASAARGLASLEVAPAVVLTSPFERARETAAIVAAALGMPLELEPALEPGADLAALAALLAAHTGAAGLLVVGHEPDLSTLVGELIGGKRGARVEMKKGACACVDLPASALRKAAGAAERLAGAGTLCWLLTAPQLARLDASARTADSDTDDGADVARVPESDHPPAARGTRTRKGGASSAKSAQ